MAPGRAGNGLELHAEKTGMVDLRRGKEGFVFLGCPIHKQRSIQGNPRGHGMQRQAGFEVDSRQADARSAGMGNYFRTGNADRKFDQLAAACTRGG